jgi:hypothetical protein
VVDAVGTERGRVAQVVAQQVGITQKLFEMQANLLDAFGAWLIFKAAACVSDELFQSIGLFQSLGLGAHEFLLSQQRQPTDLHPSPEDMAR